jgi:DNA-binding protein HU-beta
MSSSTLSAAKTSTPIAMVTLKAIIEKLAEENDLPRGKVTPLVAGLIEKITTHLKDGDRIRLTGLGTLEVRDREARTGRNPATGEVIQIAASRKVAFRPAKELKEAV